MCFFTWGDYLGGKTVIFWKHPILVQIWYTYICRCIDHEAEGFFVGLGRIWEIQTLNDMIKMFHVKRQSVRKLNKERSYFGRILKTPVKF